MNAVFVTVFCLLAVVVVDGVNANRLYCPPADLIFPCKCEYKDLRCVNLLKGSDLRKVFENVAGQSFDHLLIQASTLQYIPHEIFEKVAIRELYVYESTLVSLFDAPPTSLTTLERLHIKSSKFFRTNWQHLTPLTSLKELRILDTDVRVFDETFGKNVPKSLKEIILSGTKTRVIKPGAFHGLDNIEYLGIKNAGLTSITRDVFPTRFNVKMLSLIENKLVSIPKNLFTDMPNLKEVDLRVNDITTIPEEAFGGIASQLETILLDVNPLKCDCELMWLLTKGPKITSGVCKTPAEMEGKSLSKLTVDDFDC